MALKDHSKTLGISAASIAAIACLAFLGRKRGESLSEMFEFDEEGEKSHARSAISGYVHRAEEMLKYAPMYSEDLDMILEEAELDLMHEVVKQSIRRTNPLVKNMYMGIPASFGQSNYAGLPKGEVERWYDPQFRFLVYMSAANQAKSIVDKLERMIPKPEAAGVPSKAEIERLPPELAKLVKERLESRSVDEDVLSFSPDASYLLDAVNTATGSLWGAQHEARTVSPDGSNVDPLDASVLRNMIHRMNVLHDRYFKAVEKEEDAEEQRELLRLSGRLVTDKGEK